jgi:hypothetical protein
MASLASIGTWRGDCRRDNNVTALLFCNLFINPMITSGARQVRLEFALSDLNFVFAVDEIGDLKNGHSQVSGSILNQIVVSLPNLGSVVYAAWEYEDGSRSDVKQIGVTFGGQRPTAVALHADSSDAPTAYVAYDPHYLPKWGLLVLGGREVAQAGWSRDGVSFTKMEGKDGAFFTTLTPSAFGIAEPMPPPLTQTKDLWLKFVTVAGQTRLNHYHADLWNIARDALRTNQPLESLISCSAIRDPYVKRDTHGALKVLCRFADNPDYKSAPGILFKKIWGGLAPSELHDLDNFDRGYMQAEIDQRGLNTSVHNADINSLFHAFLSNWRDCAFNHCTGAILAFLDDAATVFFKFRYWDDKESDIVAVPVR